MSKSLLNNWMYLQNKKMSARWAGEAKLHKTNRKFHAVWIVTDEVAISPLHGILQRENFATSSPTIASKKISR